MKQCPKEFENLFLHRRKSVKALTLEDDIFGQVNFLSQGSNARLNENDAICFWRDYAIDVEGKIIVQEDFFKSIFYMISFVASKFRTVS